MNIIELSVGISKAVKTLSDKPDGWEAIHSTLWQYNLYVLHPD